MWIYPVFASVMSLNSPFEMLLEMASLIPVIQAFEESEVPTTPFTLLLYNRSRMLNCKLNEVVYTNKATNEELSFKMSTAETTEIKRNARTERMSKSI